MEDRVTAPRATSTPALTGPHGLLLDAHDR